MSKELLSDAIECFGGQIVAEVMEMVNLADPDCMYSTYQDMGMDQHADCLEMLFF